MSAILLHYHYQLKGKANRSDYIVFYGWKRGLSNSIIALPVSVIASVEINRKIYLYEFIMQAFDNG